MSKIKTKYLPSTHKSLVTNKKSKWVWSYNKGFTSRYVLGEIGSDTVLCIGLNPSNSTPKNLKYTLTRVRNISKQNDYDGWVMVNLYPKIDTYPKNLPKEKAQKDLDENFQEVTELLELYNFRGVWFAWGNNFDSRGFNEYSLKRYLEIFQDNYEIFHYGKLTRKNQPKHPRASRNNEIFNRFKVI
mgnify:CR=1 FL=1